MQRRRLNASRPVNARGSITFLHLGFLRFFGEPQRRKFAQPALTDRVFASGAAKRLLRPSPNVRGRKAFRLVYRRATSPKIPNFRIRFLRRGSRHHAMRTAGSTTRGRRSRLLDKKKSREKHNKNNTLRDKRHDMAFTSLRRMVCDQTESGVLRSVPVGLGQAHDTLKLLIFRSNGKHDNRRSAGADLRAPPRSPQFCVCPTRLVVIEPSSPHKVTRAHLHAINIHKRNDGASKVGVRVEEKKKTSAFGKRRYNTTFRPTAKSKTKSQLAMSLTGSLENGFVLLNQITIIIYRHERIFPNTIGSIIDLIKPVKKYLQHKY